jgi:spore maturation protein A
LINVIWFFMIVIAFVCALFMGNIEQLNGAIITSVQDAVAFAISLTGIMALWLGIIKIAEKSGFINSIARVLRPIMFVLFPSIPKGHPAERAIIMNLTANMFGAGNSATALGIKAMEQLNKLNPDKKNITPAMVMFLVINASSVQLIPLTVIKIRTDAGSLNSTEIVITTLIATLASTLTGIIAVKLMQGRERA